MTALFLRFSSVPRATLRRDQDHLLVFQFCFEQYVGQVQFVVRPHHLELQLHHADVRSGLSPAKRGRRY